MDLLKFKEKFSYFLYIEATAEKVWAALTHPDMTEQFFFGRKVVSTWRIGEPFLLTMPDGKIDSKGTVVEWDPWHKLAVTWHVEWLEEYRKLPEALVSFTLDNLDKVTRLTVSEAHIEPIEEKFLEGGRRGWPIVLNNLKTLLETGHSMAEFVDQTHEAAI